MIRALVLASLAAQADGAAAGPHISPAGGTYYRAPVIVKITPPGSGCILRFTLDGNEPTATSKQYMGPIPIQKTTTVRVRAFKLGAPEGLEATATYTIEPAVVFDPLRGKSAGRQAS